MFDWASNGHLSFSSYSSMTRKFESDTLDMILRGQEKKLVGLLCMHMTRYIPWNNAFWPIAEPCTVGSEDYKNKTLLGDVHKLRLHIFEIYYPLLY